MKIGVIGASGRAGTLILKEAIDRGHQVTAIVRDKSKMKDKNIIVIEKNILDLKQDDLKQFDVVVNAFGAPLGEEQIHVDAGHVLINTLKGTSTRLIVVGGVGELYVDDSKTTKVVDTPSIPEFAKPTSRAQTRNLQELQATPNINWTFISPALVFDAEGKRTGYYNLGKDQLLFNSNGEGYISYADYAIAVLDEIEDPQHINERFTVVSENE